MNDLNLDYLYHPFISCFVFLLGCFLSFIFWGVLFILESFFNFDVNFFVMLLLYFNIIVPIIGILLGIVVIKKNMLISLLGIFLNLGWSLIGVFIIMMARSGLSV